jgi:hypothetical protein
MLNIVISKMSNTIVKVGHTHPAKLLGMHLCIYASNTGNNGACGY